jgi:hypothetical protein
MVRPKWQASGFDGVCVRGAIWPRLQFVAKRWRTSFFAVLIRTGDRLPDDAMVAQPNLQHFIKKALPTISGHFTRP